MRNVLAAAAVFALTAPAVAAPDIDAPAPAFSGLATNGETVSLADFAGRKVILEWTNHECPFVVKHYQTGNMQATQAAAKDAGAVWLTVISSAPGTQGHVSAAEADGLTQSRGAQPDRLLLDESGEIGTAYAAKTTPHMFIIDEDGVLRYDGAIDDKPSANHSTVEGATNYVLAALEDLQGGQAVATSRTRPYGCSVKYAN